MFFSISTTLDSRFPNNYQINNLWVNCDDGWCSTNNTFYKGYSDNYCRITVDPAGACIEHGAPRSFPLWYQDGIVTNIDTGSVQAWTDDVVYIDHTGKITTTKIDVDLTIPPVSLTTDQALVQIRQRLDTKLDKVPENIKLFCSGGLDTLLLYSMLAGRHSFELVIGEHYEQDTFTDKNQSLLDKFWAYKQIHHWTNSTWLATGSHGDEYFLRGPTVISMLTAWHDINFGELLADNSSAYHYHYFNKYPDLWKNSWDNRDQLREEYPTIDLLHGQIMNILVNDYQHWHLGNTLTWTPYKDIEIVRILLQCDINDLLPQFIDGQLSKQMIIDYNPDIIDYLSQYKNYNKNENLSKLYEYHAKLAG
jgi:hypothetical protein